MNFTSRDRPRGQSCSACSLVLALAARRARDGLEAARLTAAPSADERTQPAAAPGPGLPTGAPAG